MVAARAEPHKLPRAGQVDRQVGGSKVIDQKTEQSFVQPVREIELLEAPARGEPRARHDEQHRFAAICRLVEGTFPALAGGDPPVRIDVEKNVVPAFAIQPIAKRHRLDIVRARMAKKDTRHSLDRDNSSPIRKLTPIFAESRLNFDLGPSGAFGTVSAGCHLVARPTQAAAVAAARPYKSRPASCAAAEFDCLVFGLRLNTPNYISRDRP